MKANDDKNMRRMVRGRKTVASTFPMCFLGRDLVLLDISKREFTATINFDYEHRICEPAKAAIDEHTGKVIAFGTDAHCMIGRTLRDLMCAWPFVDVLGFRHDVLVDSLKLMMDRIYFGKKKRNPIVGIIVNGRYSDKEIRGIRRALAEAGYVSFKAADMAEKDKCRTCGFKPVMPGDFDILERLSSLSDENGMVF